MRTRYLLTAYVLLLLFPAGAHSQNALFSGTIVALSGNQMTDTTKSFKISEVKYQVLEITSGTASGARFLITDATFQVLICDTGLLNSYTTSIVGAGAKPGDTYDVLESEMLTSGTGKRKDNISMSGDNAEWTPDEFKTEYVYLTGSVSDAEVQSFFEIQSNTSNTLLLAGTIPSYDNAAVQYTILRNPSSIPPEQDSPQLTIATDSYLSAEGTVRSIQYSVIQGKKLPLNEVDPYIAVLDPNGKLFFLQGGRWHVNEVPMFRSFFIGSDFDGVAGTFLLDPSLPQGKYNIYGVLNAPGAPVRSMKYWRSNLANASFFIP